MSGRGETPEREGAEEANDRAESVAQGEIVYNEAGKAIGKVRGFEQGGFFVTTRKGIEGFSIEHSRSGHDFGEAHLMWRCMTCGEMGEIDRGVPELCPNCGAAKEELMWWTED